MQINFSKGFSLVELIIVIAITTVLLGVITYSYRTANNNLALSSAAQEVAIAIRQAQTYAISVKEYAPNSGQFDYAYGIFFSPSFNPNYIIFADKDVDGVFSLGDGCGTVSTECVELFTLRNNVNITGVCNASTCYSSGSRDLTVIFKRPNPNATLRLYASGIVTNPSTGKIVLTSPQGTTVAVTIQSTGQVLVQ
ncbi:MAG: hypothetical protein A3H52_01020 [Candidatus Zambryskibacteria bacterium RIFCSPLOWO2_02_FULL_39_26]|uniref:General secretion pathway GspH domain-containing protein n=1 Tax=Candidatus Zambryskibacteria bacterium RIFCSPLOWO2_12_FULL_39_23 TaxID=1802776 RepID=A0A1G2URJ6_9BACT|nr:MAG: hypothetical protein A2W51_01555 [Candidatus Zambryskibacteria bacterium RIFCSPHIGHO2_02_39_10]OHA99339.1 MAG: hypothetical protein A3E59_02430 [Candidatus Zambryskibacteria bacterium RIFCSPHIGHO2_12_FULL_39_47]OHB09975.1 MAG: hypothetical protein A3H52_01020 [Candidatus Zambryskibacteria bacterium RIFCSPLOWO2_02_FULL_39_26]OHB11932.1 MAG: hypothetical protein A3G99_02610 [Candidatus Zambryskibacteria bacterium RIFCSPLOWO2_12_FULL_39_23]